MCFDFHIDEKKFCVAKQTPLTNESFFLGSVRIKGLTPHDICYDISIELREDGSRAIGARALIYWVDDFSDHHCAVDEFGRPIRFSVTPFFRSAFCNFDFAFTAFTVLSLSAFKHAFESKIDDLSWRLCFEYYNFLDCIASQNPSQYYA